VATDSFRLAKTELDFSLESGQINTDGLKIIVPLKTMQEVSRIISASTDELSGGTDQLDLFLSENQALFVYQGTAIVSRLIEGHYPDYEQVLPVNFKTEATIDRGELSRAIKMASIFSANTTNAIDLLIDSVGQKIVIEAVAGQTGSQQAELSAKIDGQNNSVRLNYRYLLECLNILSSSKVIIKLIDDVAACQISSPGDDNYQYIIVPLRK
jgi:DNA polymerase-3 subunit beta